MPFVIVFSLLFSLLLSTYLHAYVGPALSFSMLGSLWAFLLLFVSSGFFICRWMIKAFVVKLRYLFKKKP